MSRNAKYKVGDLVSLGGGDRRPSRLVIAVDEHTIGYLPIYWVSSHMPGVVESSAGAVIGNINDLINNSSK